ncbi:MAG: hypothetical protein K0S33_1796 [Bacteroidetes bacterium]|jgi:hypothetical protein|nr:hypothetical protein [Bacteroidota bacterium]
MQIQPKHAVFAAILFAGFTLAGMYATNPALPEPGMKKPSLNAGPDTLGSGTATLAPEKKVQVVFALDATGSMSGLIGTAKEKIWSIASSFTQSDTNTIVEMGLIFYRDKGDKFITKQVQLSNDMDNVYEHLMSITADGGGDSPESVNQGLYEAVTKMGWNNDTTTYKTVFLVGDCPPHMDYQDDVKYPKTCEIAKGKDIVLNTILMGNDLVAKKVWHEIANCSQGEFMQVNMNANNLVVATPYDDSIAKLSDQMDQTRMYYGTAEYTQKNVSKQVQSTKLKGGTSVSTAARRAEYNITTTSGNTAYYGTNELVNDYKAGKVKIADIKPAQLPAEVAKMDEKQKKIYLDKMVVRRDSINKEMKVLVEKRKSYIDKELSKKSKAEVETSFENQVYENVKKQAAKKKVNLKGKAKY